MSGIALAVAGAAVVIVAIIVVALRVRTRPTLTTPAERAVHATLHTASLAVRPLRRGLDGDSAAEAAPHLQRLTAADALGLADADGAVLAWTGPHESLTSVFAEAATRAVDEGRRILISSGELAAVGARALVVQPLVDDDRAVGVMGVVTRV